MNLLRRYEVWIFLILVPISNWFFMKGIDSGAIPDSMFRHGRFILLAAVLLLIVSMSRGWQGVWELIQPILNWKVSPKWYLFCALWAIMIAVLTMVIKSIYLGLDATVFHLGPDSFILKDPKNVLILLIWALIGEIVWVGYAVRSLSQRLHVLTAAMVVGTFWTAWWMPSVILNIGVIENLPAFALLLNMLGAAGMCAFVYSHTKSGLCVLILQFMMNSSAILLPVSPGGGGIPTYYLFAALYFVAMLVIYFTIGFNKDAFKKTA